MISSGHTVSLAAGVFTTITGDDWKKSFAHARERRRGTHNRILASAKAHGLLQAGITCSVYKESLADVGLFDFLKNQGQPLKDVDGPEI